MIALIYVTFVRYIRISRFANVILFTSATLLFSAQTAGKQLPKKKIRNHMRRAIFMISLSTNKTLHLRGLRPPAKQKRVKTEKRGHTCSTYPKGLNSPNVQAAATEETGKALLVRTVSITAYWRVKNTTGNMKRLRYLHICIVPLPAINAGQNQPLPLKNLPEKRIGIRTRPLPILPSLRPQSSCSPLHFRTNLFKKPSPTRASACQITYNYMSKTATKVKGQQ